MSDISKMLRDRADAHNGDRLCDEAADLIDRLTAERDALRADAERLDWLDANGFTAYRQIDPFDGLSSHCVVVHETQKPRRGNVHDTIRGAIDAARAKEDRA